MAAFALLISLPEPMDEAQVVVVNWVVLADNHSNFGILAENLERGFYRRDHEVGLVIVVRLQIASEAKHVHVH